MQPGSLDGHGRAAARDPVTWRRSSRCETGACVEAGNGPGIVGVRDSALEGSPVLEFSVTAWASFTAGLRDDPEHS